MEGVRLFDTEYKIEIDSGEDVFVKIKIISCPASVKPYGFYAEMSDLKGEVIDSAVAEEIFVTEAEAIAELNLMSEFQITPCTLCDIFY